MADFVDINGPLLLAKNTGSPLLYDDNGNISFENPIGIGVQWVPTDK